MLLIFDCDGVVLDSMTIHNEVESEAYAELGIYLAPQELAKRFAGMPLIEEFRILEREMGILFPPDAEAQIDVRKEKAFNERLKEISGISAALDELKDIPRCIASGSRLEQLRHSLSVANLYERFAPSIYSSEQVARGKPAPDLFLFAAQKMGFPPEDCLVIEDAVAGVQGALAAGMRVFGFTGGQHCSHPYGDGEQGERLVAAGAEHVFANMRELPSLIERYFDSNQACKLPKLGQC